MLQTIEFSKVSLFLPKKEINPCDVRTENNKPLEHQCAIRMGIALKKDGMSLVVPNNQKCWGQGHELHILRVEWLVSYLSSFRYELYNSGDKARNEIKKRKGIIAVMDYYPTPTDPIGQNSGDHIDLWDGNRDGNRMQNGCDSSLYRSHRIYFWELK